MKEGEYTSRVKRVKRKEIDGLEEECEEKEILMTFK